MEFKIKPALLNSFYIFIFLQSIALINIFPQSDFKNFLKVGGDIYTAPFHFDKNDWLNFSVTAAATGGSYFLDKPVKRLFLRNKNKAADFIFEIDKYFYTGGVAAATVGIYGYGAIKKDEDAKHLGLQLAEATFYASSIQILTKFILGRKRPNSNCGCTSFNPFTLDIEESSLPSAHTTLAFAFSTVMANYKDDIAWKITWYTLSSLVGMARIYHNMHWFSDVVLGAALGYFVGEFVISHNTNKETKTIPPGVGGSPKMFSFNIAF